MITCSSDIWNIANFEGLILEFCEVISRFWYQSKHQYKKRQKTYLFIWNYIADVFNNKKMKINLPDLVLKHHLKLHYLYCCCSALERSYNITFPLRRLSRIKQRKNCSFLRNTVPVILGTFDHGNTEQIKRIWFTF